MEAFGSLNTNLDKSKDLNMGLTKGTVSANAFVSGYKHADPNAFPKPTGDSFAAAGANLGFQTKVGSASAEAAHRPNVGNSVTASGNINLINHNDHKVTAHAFHTTNMPSKGPNYTSQGGGVNYSYKDTVGLEASTTHIPIARMHQHSVGANLNLHQTPTSSLNFNLGAHQTTSPFGRSNWQHGGNITFRKQF